AYSQALTPAGGTSPFSFAVTSGALPAGTTLSTPGVLGGTPTVTGLFPFTATATDAVGVTGSASYTWTIGCPTIVVNPASLPSASLGTAYSQTITQSGGGGCGGSRRAGG